jgi:hypothetical protein
MKNWTPDHVRIANAAVMVRDELRRIALRTSNGQSRDLLACADLLSRGLKVRPHAAGTPARSNRVPAGAA